MSVGDRAGVLQSIAGSALVALGFIPGFQFLIPIGASLITSGVLTFGASFLAKKVDAGDDLGRSPAYGAFQFQNRSKGDSPLPVVYSNDTASSTPGHKVAPIYLQAFATPGGFEAGEDGARGSSAQGQRLSCLLAVAEGPIEDIADIRVNDEPLFETNEDVDIGTGNGTKTKFEIEGKRIDIRSVRIYADGVLKGWQKSVRIEQVTNGNTSTLVWPIDITDDGVEIDDSQDVVWYYGTSAVSGNLVNTGAGTVVAGSAPNSNPVHPIAWIEDGRKRLVVHVQQPLTQKLWAGIPVRYLDGFTLEKTDDGKAVKVVFKTAPASGVKITASYSRKMFPHVRVETRMGSAQQLSIPGFETIRNSVSVNQTLAKGTAVTQTTDEEVDDVIVNISSTQSGFTAYDNKGGGNQAVAAQVKIEWKLSTEADAAYRILRDPVGEKPEVNKSGQEFRLSGDSTTQITWSLSVRELLRRRADDHPTDKRSAEELAAFVKARISVKVTRTNTVQNGGNSLIQDVIEWSSYTKVLDERLNHPGTALLALHAVASDKLQGSLPRITCRVIGKRDVEAYSGAAWSKSATNQANPVWAAVDLITHPVYGGGEQFTKAANIDLVSALAAATWCDTNVTHDGTTEKRSVIDYVLDTRRQLMEHVRDMLAPSQVIPVLRGNVWAFVIDQAVTLSAVTTVNDDGTSGHVMAESMAIQHTPVTGKITELQLGYLDREDDHQHADVWFAPQDPASTRRVERATAFGCTRKSHATRFGSFLYEKLRQRGVSLSWQMSPAGLPIEAGDVVRVISSRLGIDLYARIMRWEIDSTETMVVRIEAEQYIPAVYAQDTSKQTILRYSSPPAGVLSVAGPTKGYRKRTDEQMRVVKAQLRAKIRRVA